MCDNLNPVAGVFLLKSETCLCLFPPPRQASGLVPVCASRSILGEEKSSWPNCLARCLNTSLIFPAGYAPYQSLGEILAVTPACVWWFP
ncbi:hypothetical protein NPIL_187051 [Nephila pilipes]|uniref:Uncharacterized protein n=1 Tax=Nephila pilipes TaxID=299642 RepID=A0A8X6QTA5_NEPPI|nr:hypothetical protein NPIL_187051 [Nephila pilipes]